MENDILNTNQESNTRRGVPYPSESLTDCLTTIDKLIVENGTGSIITKEDISRVTGKQQNSLTLTFSTFQQYCILEKAHGKGRGFCLTSLYNKYHEKIYDHHEREALLEMFKSPPLYNKILDNLNGTILPSEEKFHSLLKGEPYNVNPNSAEKASKFFFENARFLKIIEGNNKLNFSLGDSKNPETIVKPPANHPRYNDGDLFELPIPLGGSRKAYLKYPLADLKKKDIIIIAKALNFVASSLINDNGENDFEIEIKNLEKTKGT